MAKIIKLRGPIRKFTVAVGAYSRGSLLKIFSFRVGAYSSWGGFEGGPIRGFTALSSSSGFFSSVESARRLALH